MKEQCRVSEVRLHYTVNLAKDYFLDYIALNDIGAR